MRLGETVRVVAIVDYSGVFIIGANVGGSVARIVGEEGAGV